MSVLSPDNPSTSLGAPRMPTFLSDRNFSAPIDQIASLFPMITSSSSSSSSDGEKNASTHDHIRHFCKQILVQHIPGFSVRVWDLAILLPNLIFLLFLLLNVARIRYKLRQTRSPVFKAFFVLVYLTTILNIVRCGVSMTISATDQVGEKIDKILWLVLKFFLLSAELCVLAFGLLFGHLDSHTSIRRALFATILVSGLHSSVQSVLEFLFYDKHYVAGDNDEFDLYAHGGMGFWMVSSAFFCLIYIFVSILPLTCIGRYVHLPGKRRFYVYCLCLALLNAAQVAGAALIFTDCMDGMCVVDITTFAYFTLYTPIVYFIFLRQSLNGSPSNSGGPLFSYHQQKDETGIGELPDSATYYPRFAGLTSPSYDDLFDYERSRYRVNDFIDPAYDVDFYHQTDLNLAANDQQQPLHNNHFDGSPLMLINGGHSPARPDVQTIFVPANEAAMFERKYGSGPRRLKGLGADGRLVFAEDSPSANRQII